LQKAVQQLLGRKVLEQAVAYGLSADEIVRLQSWLVDLVEAPDAEPGHHGGAGDSSLIFSKEHYEPSSGILLGQEEGGGKRGG
jgi:hypothetical protein